ncbi:MAG: ATP-binding protein [Acidimicrobiales bacterium]
MTGFTGQVGTRSVLFTDLVGSTELRVRLGEERADALRRDHDTLVIEAITTHAGTVVKGLGDGLMATFASAADAVAAAVAVQQAVHGQEFGVRVGLSIGDVSTENDDVFGVPVVEAARLCSIATGGEILVAEFVRVLSRGRGGFVFEPIGEVDLKGLPDPVPACRVLWEPLPLATGRPQVPIAPALMGAAATNYVGRETLRDRLLDAWRAACQGRCQTVLLAGEPGVGKTRTAAELARTVSAEGTLVLYGRCDEDLGVPYQPFVEALEYYITHAIAPVLGRLPGELARVVPDIGQHVSSLPPPVASDPGSEEHRLMEATASWLIDAANASVRGLVLVVDDLHWATKPTLRLLYHVVRTAIDSGAPLLVVATYRDTDIDRTHPLAAAMADLRRLSGVDRMPIENLTSAEVEAFIAAAAGHELDEGTLHLAVAVYAETEGNPFFVGEVLRHLVETGGVRRHGDRWVVADPDHVSVPEGVRDVVGRRLNRLSTCANETLSVGAVVGREFDVDVLAGVVDATDDAMLDALDEAVRARLVEETGVDRYRFAHALVRTTLYEELSATRRRRLHRRVAEAFEKVHPNDVEALAYHCTEAGPVGGDISRAVQYTLAAGDKSLAARAFADAEVRFRSALDLLDDAGPEGQRETAAALCGLGEAQRDQGDQAFRETLLDASRRALELGDAPLLLRAVLANGRGISSIVGGVDPERVALIEQALDLTGATHSAARAKLVAQLASELTFSGDHERRLALADDAEHMARMLNDDALLGSVLVTTGYASVAGRRWEQLVARTAEARRLADGSGDPTLRVVARVFESGALLTAGHIRAAERVTLDCLGIAEADGAPLALWLARTQQVRISILGGRFDEADVLNNQCLAMATELQQGDGESWWAATLVGATWLRGYAGELADAAAEVADQYPLARIWRCAHAWLLAEAGRVDEAGKVIREYALDPAREDIEPFPLACPFLLARAAWRTGDRDLAARAAAALMQYRGCWAHYYLVVVGPVSWALGLALAATGASAEAVTLLDEGLDAAVECGALGYVPTIRTDLAEVLMQSGTPEHLGRAEALLAEARAEAVAIGATGIADRIDSLARGR